MQRDASLSVANSSFAHIVELPAERRQQLEGAGALARVSHGREGRHGGDVLRGVAGVFVLHDPEHGCA